MKRKKQQVQPAYNQTHTLENRSTISSHVNQTGNVNDPSLSNTVSCNRLHIIYHGIVREVHKKCMKLQTSSRSKSNERDIVFLRMKINSSSLFYRLIVKRPSQFLNRLFYYLRFMQLKLLGLSCLMFK